MITATTAKAAYVSPECRYINLDTCDILCSSTEGYSFSSGGLTEDDWLDQVGLTNQSDWLDQ